MPHDPTHQTGTGKGWPVIDGINSEAPRIRRNSLVQYRQAFLAEEDPQHPGSLDIHGLRRALLRLGIHVSEEDLDAMIWLVDQNFNGQIEENEFVQIGYVLENTTDPKDASQILFLAADTDLSGSIDPVEMYRILTRMEISVEPELVYKVLERVTGSRTAAVDYKTFRVIFRSFVNGTRAARESTR